MKWAAQFMSQRPSGTHNAPPRVCIDVLHMRACYDGEKTHLEILMDLYVFSPDPKVGRSGFWYAVCMDGWMDGRARR